MEENQQKSAEDAVQRITSFILEQIKSGTDKETCKTRLIASGVREEIAGELVEQVYSQATHLAAEEEFTGGSLLPAILGGGLAAVAGGLIWGLITITTGYEIGWVAWGVGLLAGWGVVMFARGRKGMPLQIVAVGAAILGVVIGKYITFYAVLKEYVAEEYGVEAVAQMSMLSLGVIQFFGSSIGAMLSGFDLLWVILAVGTAWGIPKAKVPKPVPVEASASVGQ